MITLINPKATPFIVQYTYGNKVYRKEVLGGTIMAFKNLTTYDQIKNEGGLISAGIGIYDANASSFINQGGVVLGFRTESTQTGMTIMTPLRSVATGYTIVTSANTVMALNTITANTNGNIISVVYSGTSISTKRWLDTINATAFSGMGFSVFGESPSTFLAGAGTTSWVFTANEPSSNVVQWAFATDSSKESDYPKFKMMNFPTGTTILRTML